MIGCFKEYRLQNKIHRQQRSQSQGLKKAEAYILKAQESANKLSLKLKQASEQILKLKNLLIERSHVIHTLQCDKSDLQKRLDFLMEQKSTPHNYSQ